MNTSTMSAIGERLKKTRESRSLTIDQVQKQTRIHSSVLIALEEGRCDKMLTPTYVKSFLKKYSSHLGLDSKEFMNEYSAAHPELRAQEIPSVTQTMESAAKEKEPSLVAALGKARPFIIALTTFVIIVLIVGGVTKFFIDRNRVRIVMATNSKDSKTKKLKAPVEKTPAKKAAVVKEPVKNEVNAQKAAAGPVVIPSKQPLRLAIKATRDVFISASADGERLFKKLLRKGMSETITADVSINLYIVKAESVTLTLNGKSINPGKGLIKNLEITQKGVRAR